MTLLQIMLRTVAQLGEDPDAIEEYRELLLGYINEAYADMTRIYKPIVTEEIELDENGDFPISALERQLRTVVEVRFLGFRTPVVIRDSGTLHVPGCGGRLVRIRYRFEQAMLENDADVPELPPQYHGYLADYATSRVLGNGSRQRQQRGEVFFARYFTGRGMIPVNVGDRDSRVIRGKYGRGNGDGDFDAACFAARPEAGARLGDANPAAKAAVGGG